MVHRSGRFVWIAATLILGSVLLLAAAEKRQQRLVTTAYFSDAEVQVQPSLQAGKTFSYGPWALGAIVHDDKASDHRFNLYVIVPGAQHQAPPPADEFNHSVLLNSAGETADKEPGWDVFWVVVLDPDLNQ